MAAADSSHALQDRATRDEHLDAALDLAPLNGTTQQQELREGAQMRSARWALDDRDASGALERLGELPHGAARRTIALRIKLKATRLARQTQPALETARLLAKHKAFSPEASASLLRSLLLEQIHSAHDAGQLLHAWSQAEARERSAPELAIPAARRLVALGGDSATAREWLLPVWEAQLQQPQGLHSEHSTRLVLALQESLDDLDAAWLGRIEAALRHAPHNPRLQYLAGMACLQRQLWGKAQQLLGQSTSSSRTRHCCTAPGRPWPFWPSATKRPTKPPTPGSRRRCTASKPPGPPLRTTDRERRLRQPGAKERPLPAASVRPVLQPAQPPLPQIVEAFHQGEGGTFRQGPLRGHHAAVLHLQQFGPGLGDFTAQPAFHGIGHLALQQRHALQRDFSAPISACATLSV
jgi:hypothetical protein